MNYNDFVNQFSAFSLADKAIFPGEGIVTRQSNEPGPAPNPLRVCYRKNIRKKDDACSSSTEDSGHRRLEEKRAGHLQKMGAAAISLGVILAG